MESHCSVLVGGFGSNVNNIFYSVNTKAFPAGVFCRQATPLATDIIGNVQVSLHPQTTSLATDTCAGNVQVSLYPPPRLVPWLQT